MPDNNLMDDTLVQETKQQTDKIDRQTACVEGYEVLNQHFAPLPPNICIYIA